MNDTYTYENAFAELQQIVFDIESGTINVDELALKIDRAGQLLAICKAKLSKSEAEVESMLKKLSADSSPDSDGSEPLA